MNRLRLRPILCLPDKAEHPVAPVIRNIGWLMIDKVVRLGGGIAVVVWLARYLGPEQFGQLNYAIAFVGLFAAVAGFELNSTVVRDLVRHPRWAGVTMGTAFLLQLTGGVVAAGLVVLAITIVDPGDGITRVIVAILSFGLVLKSTDVIKYWFESRVESRYTVWVETSAFLIVAAAKVLMIVHQAPLISFVWASVAESALVALGLPLIYRQKKPLDAVAWQPQIARARTLLRDCWPFMLSGIAVTIYMRIDQIILGQMLGAGAVGIYTAAVRMSEVTYLVYMLIASSAAPLVIKARYQNPVLYQQRLTHLYRTLIGLSVSTAVVMSFCASPLVQLLYGTQYREAGTVLAVQIWAGIPVALGVASSQALLLEDLQLYSLYRTLIGCGLNIVLNLLFIPSLGVVGSAIATLVSYSAATFALALFPPCRSILSPMLDFSWRSSRPSDERH